MDAGIILDVWRFVRLPDKYRYLEANFCRDLWPKYHIEEIDFPNWN